MTSFIVINGLDFNLFIRGLLVVLVGVVVLMGSTYLILATNSGFRTGGMLALTGFFGWMTIMGFIWVLYGIGLQGRLPSWHVFEINRGDLASAQFVEAQDLAGGLEETSAGVSTDPAALDAWFRAAEESQEAPKVGEWTGVLASNRARGEAQAAVDAWLVGNKVFGAGTYVPVAAFVRGGKDPRPAGLACGISKLSTWDECIDRAGRKLHSIFIQPRHPAKQIAVMVSPASPETLIVRPGEAPPVKVLDPDQPMYTVLMERDLGSKRLPPFLIMIGSGIIFAAFAWRLHERDKAETAARAAYAAGKA